MELFLALHSVIYFLDMVKKIFFGKLGDKRKLSPASPDLMCYVPRTYPNNQAAPCVYIQSTLPPTLNPHPLISAQPIFFKT